MSIQDHPEPVEPPAFLTPQGEVYCLVHGTENCQEPWCWRCSNHEMDDWQRCADPRCRATNTPEALALIEELKAEWKFRPAPLEVITYELGRMMRPPSSLPVGDSAEPEQTIPPAPRTGRIP